MEAYISSLIRIDDSCTRHHFFPIKKHIFAHKKTSLDNIYKETTYIRSNLLGNS